MATKVKNLSETLNTAEEAIFGNDVEETTLVSVNAVTSNGREKETELAASPLVMSQEKLQSLEQQLSRLDQMTTGVCLNAKYKEFDAVGEVVRGIYLGIKPIYKGRGAERQEIPAAQWIDSDKQLWINAGTILVNQMKDIPSGTPVEILYSEKIKMDVGIAKNYEVRALYE